MILDNRQVTSQQLLGAALAIVPIVTCGATYLLLPGLREEVNRVASFLLREDFGAVRSYVLLFGL